MWCTGFCMIAFVAFSARAVSDIPLTPVQLRLMEVAKPVAEVASAAAEAELLKEIGSLSFRIQMLLMDSDLVRRSPESLLKDLKRALVSMEWTSNFGVDAAFVASNPGAPMMNFDTLEHWGRIPGMWELKANRSDLVKGIPRNQWRILDAAETAFYGLPPFLGPDRLSPTAAEAFERPSYLGGNLRRADLGIMRYGAYAAVLRNDVVRERALVLTSDSGGWENGCNTSLTPVQSWSQPLAKVLLNGCDNMYAGGAGGRDPHHVVPATSDHLLHALLHNARIFSRLGGGLPRLMHEFLSPGAIVPPLETLFYLEGGLLGPLRMEDVKLIVANFPGVYGTSEADKLRAYCARHDVPLAWGLGGGRASKEELNERWEWLPFSPVGWLAGAPRLLDPSSCNSTTVRCPLEPSNSLQSPWVVIEAEVQRERQLLNGTAPLRAQWQDWFARLMSLASPSVVWPLRGGDCPSPDLCFGTFEQIPGQRECICRRVNALSPAESDARMGSTLFV